MFTRILLAGLLSLPAASALAQMAGTYTGSTADGQSVSFTVTQDSTSGDYSITSENISFSAPCNDGSTTLNTGWGTGSTIPITNKVAKLALQDDYFYFSGTLRFNGTAMSGTLASTSPDLSYNTAGRPARALICRSPAQSVTATLSTTADAVPSAATKQPKAVLFGSAVVHSPVH